jgi:hypothetical protein
VPASGNVQQLDLDGSGAAFVWNVKASAVIGIGTVGNCASIGSPAGARPTTPPAS